MKNIAVFLIMLSLAKMALAGGPAQDLKKSLVGGCVSRGLERGDNPDAVYAFCTCTWDVLSHNLTVAEYVQLDATSNSKISPATLPFWAKIQPKLQECKEKETNAVKP